MRAIMTALVTCSLCLALCCCRPLFIGGPEISKTEWKGKSDSVFFGAACRGSMWRLVHRYGFPRPTDSMVRPWTGFQDSSQGFACWGGIGGGPFDAHGRTLINR